MNNLWENLLVELGLFTFLGVLYYFYQKRKILKYEENKIPLVMGFILQSCLTEKNEMLRPKLDALILALDDYLHNRTPYPPLSLLTIFMESSECSTELREIIREGLVEIGNTDGKK